MIFKCAGKDKKTEVGASEPKMQDTGSRMLDTHGKDEQKG
jgi:hypothetical protein